MSPFKAGLDDPAGTTPCADIMAVEGPGVAEVEKREGELTSFTTRYNYAGTSKHSLGRRSREGCIAVYRSWVTSKTR